MKTLVQYHIISGNVVETRRTFLPVQQGRKVRGVRRAGASSARKISLNERQEALRLGREMNASFYTGGYLATFKYADGRLPASYEELCKNGKVLMRKLSAACKKLGIELKRVLINANWSPKRDAPARLHHHLVVNKIPLELLREIWPEGEIDIRTLRRGDLTGLAAYLYQNVKVGPGKKHWNPSRNLDKPIYTEPVPVQDADGIAPMAGATEIYQEPSFDEDGRQSGSYMRCVLEAPPRVRGGQIILPKPVKRGGRRC